MLHLQEKNTGPGTNFSFWMISKYIVTNFKVVKVFTFRLKLVYVSESIFQKDILKVSKLHIIVHKYLFAYFLMQYIISFLS
jgi:hypothetical protein